MDSNTLHSILLIILAGCFGGFAHALYYHNNKIIYPRKGSDKQNTWFSLGFLSDILLGAIAGLAGALPLAGAQSLNDPDNLLQFIYVALISGFGGGAFLKNIQGKINDNKTNIDSSTISLNIPPEKTLPNGQSDSLIAYLRLGSIDLKDVTKEVNWSSQDNTIVSVSNGQITANGVGQSIITASIPGNKNLSATCTVKVG